MAAPPRLLQILRRPPADPAGRCDVCGGEILEAHDHLVDLRARALRCACRACYLLFTHEGAGGGRLRAVPQRYVHVPDLGSAGDPLDTLDLPIGLAFFFRSSVNGRVGAFYPGPAGATESELPLDAWQALAAAVPVLASMATDVEALIVRRRDSRTDAFIVPIDVSYELVGRIRVHWRGLGGGDEASGAIDDFFARVAERASADAPVVRDDAATLPIGQDDTTGTAA